jgi:hypothetical protein
MFRDAKRIVKTLLSASTVVHHLVSLPNASLVVMNDQLLMNGYVMLLLLHLLHLSFEKYSLATHSFCLFCLYYTNTYLNLLF